MLTAASWPRAAWTRRPARPVQLPSDSGPHRVRLYSGFVLPASRAQGGQSCQG